MRRYEDRNYSSLLVMFLIAGCVSVAGAATLGFALWEDPAILTRRDAPDWVQAAGLGCFVGFFPFACFAWGIYRRPRLVADETGGVWIANGVVQFRWDEITSWCQVIKVDSEGGESSNVELRTTDGRLLLIEGNTVEDIVKAFHDFLPTRQSLTRRST